MRECGELNWQLLLTFCAYQVSWLTQEAMSRFVWVHLVTHFSAWIPTRKRCVTVQGHGLDWQIRGMVLIFFPLHVALVLEPCVRMAVSGRAICLQPISAGSVVLAAVGCMCSVALMSQPKCRWPCLACAASYHTVVGTYRSLTVGTVGVWGCLERSSKNRLFRNIGHWL